MILFFLPVLFVVILGPTGIRSLRCSERDAQRRRVRNSRL